jgi:hypothetical protein
MILPPPVIPGSSGAGRSTIRVARAIFRPVRFALRAVRRTARRAFRITFRPARRILRATRRPVRRDCRAARRLARLVRRLARLACLCLRGMFSKKGSCVTSVAFLEPGVLTVSCRLREE